MDFYDDEGEPLDLGRFTHKIVCPRCRGNGFHVNPSVDGPGISTDDECWQDDDFREMYLGGGYDVACHECDGRNVIDELDWERIERDEPELFASLNRQLDEMHDLAQMEAMERRMGA